MTFIDAYLKMALADYVSLDLPALPFNLLLSHVHNILVRPNQPNGAPDKEAKIAAWKVVQDSHLPKHYALLETNLVKSGKPFLGGDKPNAADVAFFAVNNIYAKASIDTDKVLSDVAPTLQKALTETTKLGSLSNFAPGRGLYFSSDPENGSF